MMVDERTVSFINSLDPGNPAYLDEIEKYAIETFVPIIRKDMQAYLRYVIKSIRPKKILEVGTAIGFSALLMSEYAPKDCHITTIENYEPRIPIALKNFEDNNKKDSITLIEGDALKILPTLNDEYDLIFMDAAKGQYINYLPDLIRLLKSGGTLISDNVLQDGDIIESKYAIVRRNRTIHNRMREYLYELKHNDMLTTAILPVGDGITVSVKNV
ncbi:MAG: O-methyltransferase [Lachnospiraceae bacterium]|nr:O-methyltransferase [Lachnospiraceae bacterium]MBP5415361.1 O-methyltransferase [Lachnospiraceae bacterium]MBP5746158.1 O-methyltransferase [Lachnospiraceae bacterium]